jgi:alanyl-tRNA synthetase
MNKIREKFIEFFSKNDHVVVDSSSLIPHNDPTLLFVNAGMVQFKDYFLQKKIPKYKNLVTSQKCIRAGGKHNDLENVGFTKRHHTFFEMLGNFSFGGYFKENAINLAWNFITEELGLDKNKIYITIYKDDDEAFNIWQNITGFNENKIIRISTDDNFWQMGDVGPCGPCSEIYYDHGDHLEGTIPGDNVDTGERYVEIWNLVFMQYYKDQTGAMIKLPTPCIDTGMGLERISAVLEKTDDNYNIEIFKLLIEESQKITGDKKNKIAHRIIADHLRSSVFLIADGVMPSNTGRGYVLRRIIRRAVRYISMIGFNQPLFSKIFPILENHMGKTYPEIIRARDLIITTLDAEEESFHLTLKNGLKILEHNIQHLNQGDILSGEVAFTLYDTYGFPLDLTIDILKDKQISVDEKSFNERMSEQKTRARASWIGSGEEKSSNVIEEIYKKHGTTEFLGYENLVTNSRILAILDKDYQIIEDCDQIRDCIIILDKTPFYAESGGQEGDHGVITCDKLKFSVYDTKKSPIGVILHYCKVLSSGTLNVGGEVLASVNQLRRKNLMNNHSATHLLHHALRKILGNHVSQKGSLVAEDKLRFDFSYHKQITDLEKSKIENEVNLTIWSNHNVNTCVKNVNDAINSGAIALFGEKYDENVRIVSMGDSIELCGGTHVNNTSTIGMMIIVSEGSIARGIRRIEAVTNMNALDYLRAEKNKYLNEIQNLETKIHSENKIKQQELFKLYKTIISDSATQIELLANNLSLIIKKVRNIPQDIIKRIIKDYKKDNSIIVFFNIESDKVFLYISFLKGSLETDKINVLTDICKKETNANFGHSMGDLIQIIFSDQTLINNSILKIKEVLTTI